MTTVYVTRTDYMAEPDNTTTRQSIENALKRAWKLEFVDQASENAFFEVWGKSEEDIWDFCGEHMVDSYGMNASVHWYSAHTLEELRDKLEEKWADFLDEEEADDEEN
jgi:hypothetical protein